MSYGEKLKVLRQSRKVGVIGGTN